MSRNWPTTDADADTSTDNALPVWHSTVDRRIGTGLRRDAGCADQRGMSGGIGGGMVPKTITEPREMLPDSVGSEYYTIYRLGRFFMPPLYAPP